MTNTIIHEYAEFCGYFETEIDDLDNNLRVFKCKGDGHPRLDITEFCSKEELACFRQMHEVEVEEGHKDRFDRRRPKHSGWKVGAA